MFNSSSLFRLVPGVLFTLLASGCSTTPPTSNPPTPSMPTDPGNVGATGPKMLNVTPLTTLADNDGSAQAEGGIFTNAYTRVLIFSSVADELSSKTPGEIAILPYKSRSAFARYLVGEKYDMNLSVRMKIGAFEATAPLVTLSHQSNSNGEQWSRTISQRLGNFPLFLVKADGEASIPTFNIKVAGSKAYSSNMVGKSLDLLVAGLKEVVPEAGVLSSLTAESAKNRSKAIDTAIGQLFSNGMSEEHTVHRDFLKWNRAGGIVVSLQLPATESSSWEKQLTHVGSWTITFESPRPSIFSDWKICPANPAIRCAPTRAAALAALRQEVSARQVLNYSLLAENRELATMENLVTRNSWYVTAAGAYSGDAVKDAAVADRVCTEIQNIVIKLGLNHDDADIVTWAFISGMPAPPKIHNKAFRAARPDGQPTSCKRALQAVTGR